MTLLWIILIGIAAGFLAGKIMKGRGFGLWINLLLGIGGSLIGGWLFGDLLGSGIFGSLIRAVVGAVLLIFVVNLIKGKK